ncbi:hypothetical protein F2P81_001102 [Scophthalmus maximus]|uniref:Uncharacterized protein n=1 Tax=Scophthalmus maximus TaxID=52904 RepID=A0A6A4TRG2_SCOMX|nr:hypothetical protein F2P81_001102 [Scophthalmus maximus]
MSLDAVPSANVIVVETSNLIIRSASEFCLSAAVAAAPVTLETQESTFSSNPFFKLRSLSSQSLVEREIRMVKQREEEWRRQREEMWRRRREEEWRRGRERYETVLVSPGLNDNISFNGSLNETIIVFPVSLNCPSGYFTFKPVPEVPDRCVSSPSSPSRIRKMERSSLSCDHKHYRYAQCRPCDVIGVGGLVFTFHTWFDFGCSFCALHAVLLVWSSSSLEEKVFSRNVLLLFQIFTCQPIFTV